MSKERNRWGSPGWPWELELLAFIFVVVAIAVPAWLQYMQAAGQNDMTLFARTQLEQQRGMAWQNLSDLIWALALVGVYIGHLIIAAASVESISTPFTHLFSPLVFAAVTYYRLYMIRGANVPVKIVQGSVLEMAIWFMVVVVITILVARLRMARHLLRFRGVQWDFETPAKFDATYFEMLVHFHPLVYPPRMYHVCREGLLIEGWLYVMPLSFDSLGAVDAPRSVSVTTSGLFLATSSRTLMRLRMLDKSELLYISPQNRAELLHYCEARIVERKPTGITSSIPIVR